MNIRLHYLFKLLSPLSHIGETISTHTFLVEHPILQPDRRIEKVFCYQGNALRGQLRDLSALELLELMGGIRVPLPVFHLLFSGGKIGGDQQTDIAAMRKWRDALPHIALFGGGVGNQILEGKLRVGGLYPVCQEAIPVLPDTLHEQASAIRYGELTFESSFSRKDDEKDVRLAAYQIPDAEDLLKLQTKKKKPARKDGDEGDDEIKTQQRMTAELMIPGTLLYGEADCLYVSDVELGAFLSAWVRFGRSPHLGGQCNKGHGRVSLELTYTDLETGDSSPLLTIGDTPSQAAVTPSGPVAGWIRAYRQKTAAHKGEVIALLGAQPQDAEFA